MLAATKPRKCSQCGTLFAPLRAMANVCSPVCAYKLVKTFRAAEKVALKKRKADIKPRSKWLAECQAIVNRYVRILALSREHGCYTCGATPAQKFGGTYDAGHFRSVGSAPHLRYWIPQIKLQCIPCNRHKGGMALAFRRALVVDHGSEWVERLEGMQDIAKFSVAYLARFKVVMGKKLKRLEKRCSVA